MTKYSYSLLLTVALLLTGCKYLDQLSLNPFADTSERARYAQALSAGALGGSALVQTWQAVGKRAREDSARVTTPFQEVGYFDQREPSAVGYRLELKEGDAIRARLVHRPRSVRVFGELLRRRTEGDSISYQFVAQWDTTTYQLEYEVRRAGTYVLHLQPELLASCYYELAITQYPPLNFPVQGRGNKDVGSVWGDARDGGRRQHEGVDIFAPRGTPVLAISKGRVTRVADGGLGGKTVWVSDAQRSVSLYYAHLDSQLVTVGQAVAPGDTLGTVGNTGNARTTPPHLHFGIYRSGSGATDPLPYIYQHSQELPRLTADTSQLGDWVRVTTRAPLPVQGQPLRRSQQWVTLPRHEALRVEGAARDHLRVRLMDGSAGYVPAASVTPIGEVIDRATLDTAYEVRVLPYPTAAPIGVLPAGEQVSIIATTARYWMVRLPDGRSAWLVRSG